MNKLFIEENSRNVFADLNISNANEYLVKAKLAARISEIVNQKNWTQIKAARLLGINQPKISALMSEKLDGFSSERLFYFLNTLN